MKTIPTAVKMEAIPANNINENNACTLEEISKVQAYFFTGKLDFGMMFLEIIDNLIVAWRKRVCYNVRKDFLRKEYSCLYRNIHE